MRSQFALELTLSVLSVLAMLLILRLAFTSLSISDRVWAGSVVYGLTDRLVWPLALLPGAERPVFGQTTLKELTAFLLVAMISFILATRGRSSRP